MQVKQQNFDQYVQRARLAPALVVAFPLALTVIILWANGIGLLSFFGSLLVWGGLAALIAQIGRDWGKRQEPRLFAAWGGNPTTKRLRHRDTSNIHILARRHAALQKLLTDIRLPTIDEERADAKTADKLYEVCTAYLREHTRDHAKFPLVFEELCNYGFRRNLWGMRGIGILFSAVACLSFVIMMGLSYFSGGSWPSPIVIIAGLLSLFLLICWVIIFTEQWVKAAADAYAERLLETAEPLCRL